jgi:hypothetical protein
MTIRVFKKRKKGYITCFSCVIIYLLPADGAVSRNDRTDNVPFHEWRLKRDEKEKTKLNEEG